MSAVPCEGKMCLHRCFSLLYFCSVCIVIKPINTDVQLLNNNSSHGSFQLGAANMGKMPLPTVSTIYMQYGYP
jgi:hypothetical protein